MRQTAVSLIVPTYRRPRELRACLQALAAQSMPEPWELIIVDDGSPEPVDLGCLVPTGALTGIKLIRQANAGPAAARNRGAREASGEFVAFTDDDCRPNPAWLCTLVQCARGRPGALVGGLTYNGLESQLLPSTSQLIVDLVYEHFNADPGNAYFLASNNALCERERFLDVGGFDRSFPRAGAEDREFCDRWRVSGWPIVWCPAARVEHLHAQNLRQFLGLHYRYGRGAYMYQRVRRARGSGSMADDLGFHGTLPRRIMRHLRKRRGIGEALAMLAALGAWQVANAAGFAVEAITPGGEP